MHVWITKYWQTQGIKEREVTPSQYVSDVVLDISTGQIYRQEGRDWHRTSEAATNYVAAARERKVESLARQIKQLQEKA